MSDELMKELALNDLLNGLPCAFLSLTDDGTIREVNDTLLAFLGFGPGELEGRSFDTILPPGGRVFYQTHLFPLLKLQSTLEEIYLVLRARDGTDVPVLLYGGRRERDGVLRNDCVLTRVTRREQYQDEMARARERVIGVLGHDLRVPMTAAAFAVEQLVRRETLSDEGQRIALAAMSSARRAARMTMDLLDFARVRFAGGIPIQRQASDLRVAAEKVIAELQTIHPDAEIALNLDGDTSGSWDADRVAQAAANLISNAIQHGAQNRPIAVSISGVPDEVTLEVRNGLASATTHELGQLFVPFHEGAHAAGLGLGLFIVREIVAAHGGRIEVTTAAGEFAARTVWPRSG